MQLFDFDISFDLFLEKYFFLGEFKNGYGRKIDFLNFLADLTTGIDF